MQNDDVEISKHENIIDHTIDMNIAKVNKKIHGDKPYDTKFVYGVTRNIAKLRTTVDDIWHMFGRKRCSECNGLGFIAE
ncbi:MAG: hypothetical protein HOD60_08875 [Candidatus Nitrosopelagicus sp.]|jgi:hypothetical protein|nr:hypothetical protein [Candidatus Nitrosopelagicus sp.]